MPCDVFSRLVLGLQVDIGVSNTNVRKAQLEPLLNEHAKFIDNWYSGKGITKIFYSEFLKIPPLGAPFDNSCSTCSLF